MRNLTTITWKKIKGKVVDMVDQEINSESNRRG